MIGKLTPKLWLWRPTVLLVMALCGLTGCPEWQATPVRVESAYGQADRSMLNAQIYNPDKARHPASLAPDGLEGEKADTVLQETYRDDIGSSERVRKRAQLGIRSSGTGAGLSVGGSNY
jgi:hypothetical protein